jgi:Leucine-rich repeat (LRR) protein
MEWRCDAGRYFVNCTDSSLNSIPLTFPAAVRGFLLRDNSITSFEKDSFIRRGLTELEILSADNCEIRTIAVGAFNGLTKLTLLSMQYNDISNITKGTFENMRRLERLKLGYNGIEQLKLVYSRG